MSWKVMALRVSLQGRAKYQEDVMTPRPVCDAAVNLVKQYEGIPGFGDGSGTIRPYLDPVGIWTVGWGHAIESGGHFPRGNGALSEVKALYPGGITVAQAETLLQSDLMQAGAGVLASVSVALNDNQYGALTSFTFNLGLGNLRSSTLLTLLNAGNFAGAADQFLRWCRANGSVLPGLLKRRAAERSLFLQAPSPPPALPIQQCNLQAQPAVVADHAG
jgi:lysozyme